MLVVVIIVIVLVNAGVRGHVVDDADSHRGRTCS